MQALIMVLLIAAAFLAAVLNLAAESRFKNSVMRAAIVIAFLVGSVYYGSGYAWSQGISIPSFIQALLALCRMFGGVNDLGSIRESPLVQNQMGLAVFWIGHFCAFYVTASAAISTLGDRLLQRIRLTMVRQGPLLLVYGVNDASVSYARKQAQESGRSVLFVDENGSGVHEGVIRSMGAVFWRGADPADLGTGFLRQVHMRPGGRRLEAAAFQEEGRKNLRFARELAKALHEAGIDPAQTSLLIRGVTESAETLQAGPGPGFGTVYAFDDYELAARSCLQNLPPCDTLSFDENGVAQENLEVCLIGFGRTGRAMLMELVRNGQFAGSTFRADIFDPSAQNGCFYGDELMKDLDIRFHREDAQTEALYAFLEERGKALRMIVIAAGSRRENLELEADIAGWYRTREEVPAILQVTKDGYSGTAQDGRYFSCLDVYGSEALNIARVDAMAMQINRRYSRDGLSAEEAWKHCDYFSRMSCRASADFYPAFVRASGTSLHDVRKGQWAPKGELLENLAITEHLRWCAFHLTMGFVPMSEEEYAAREQMYLEEVRRRGKSSIRIGKDMAHRRHACLIPWEDLDALAAREYSVTGIPVDYRQMDRENVLAVGEVIAAMERAKRHRKTGEADA